MNEKRPNKYNVPQARSYTFDSEKNDWLVEDYGNFYFFDEEYAEVVYYNYEGKKQDSD